MAKILIVDDNPDILHVMQLLLGTRGFEVISTPRGEETFDIINKMQPQLVFIDIHLSGIDGRDISRMLKTTEATKHLPVILFSANIINGTTLEESLADDFIAKPFDIHDLMLKVNKLLEPGNSSETMTA
jgi:DNA-binding response OmpR family regulator